MLSIFAVLLGLAVIAIALSADRASRGHQAFRAIGLNLFGLGCLACGLVAIFMHSPAGRRPDRPVAVFDSAGVVTPASQRALMVRLIEGRDGHLTSPSDVQPVGPPGLPDVLQVRAEDDPLSQGADSEDSEPREPMYAESDAEAISRHAEDPDRASVTTEMTARSSAEIDFDARPEWVDQPDRDVGNIHQIPVCSGPFSRLQEANEELGKQLKESLDEYINEIARNPQAARWVGYSPDEIRSRFVLPHHVFQEKIISSVGVMHQSHALLALGPAFHAEVGQAWHEVRTRTQLAKMALIGGAIFGVLVLLFGYFNADNATRGFYSRRLKFATALAILALVATGIFIARSISWLWL